MSFRVGRVGGIAIEVDVSWFIVFALVVWSLSAGVFPRLLPGAPASVTWATGIIAALLFFGSVLLHELGHSFVAVRNGLPVSGITLFVFGGVSKITEEPRTPGLELRMALAGPLVSFALGLLFWGLTGLAQAASWPPQVAAVASYLSIINVILGVFNLVPGFPLDGGRVLRAILWARTGSLERSSRWASWAGQGFGYLLMLWGAAQLLVGGNLGGIWLLFIGWFLAGAAQSAYQQVLLRRALSGVPVERIMQRDVPHVAPDLSLRDLVDGYFMRMDYNAYPVVQNDSLVGVVTVDDVREVPRETWDVATVGQVARQTDAHRVIGEDEDAWDALTQMAETDARRLLVVRNGHLEGIVSRDSILNLVRTRMQLGT